MRLCFVLAAALVLVACAQTSASEDVAHGAWMQNLSNLPDGGTPVDADGLYNNMGSCPGEGCSISVWQRVQASTPLREQPTPTGRVTATLSEGEWVRSQSSVYRTRPHRGVVVDETAAAQEGESGPGLRAGDVVYTVDYEGEGYVTLWRRGDYFTWYDSGGEGVVGGIRWDPADPGQHETDVARGAGFWLQVQRDDGQSGWAPAESMECIGAIDPTPLCVTRNAEAEQ